MLAWVLSATVVASCSNTSATCTSSSRATSHKCPHTCTSMYVVVHHSVPTVDCAVDAAFFVECLPCQHKAIGAFHCVLTCPVYCVTSVMSAFSSSSLSSCALKAAMCPSAMQQITQHGQRAYTRPQATSRW
jgi:hypothetical protein